jgi:hypothetical protein
MTGDWAGNGLAGNSGWAPKDRSRSARKRKPIWPWFIVLALCVLALVLFF